MSGEERARETLNEFEKRADEVVEHLKDMHKEEYTEWRRKLALAREGVAAECRVARKGLDRIARADREGPTLAAVGKEVKINHAGLIAVITGLKVSFTKA